MRSAGKIFLRLTQPGEGTEDTKRRASFSELITVAKNGEGEAITSLVRRLADGRLVTARGTRRRCGPSSPAWPTPG